MELTKSEMEIMDVLWENGTALSRADFLTCSEEKSWKDSSVHILLNSLLSKGMIRETGVVKCGKTYARTFLPTMTREEYFAMTIYSHRYKPELIALIQALLNQQNASQEQLTKIAAIVEKRKDI